MKENQQKLFFSSSFYLNFNSSFPAFMTKQSCRPVNSDYRCVQILLLCLILHLHILNEVASHWMRRNLTQFTAFARRQEVLCATVLFDPSGEFSFLPTLRV